MFVWILLGLVALRVLWTVVWLAMLAYESKRTYLGSAGIGLALLAILPEAFLVLMAADTATVAVDRFERAFDRFFNVKR